MEATEMRKRVAPFTYIYVEKEVMDHHRTRRILGRFPQSRVVEIRHYKDVFNRRRQNIPLQHESQSLILAAKKGERAAGGAGAGQCGEENSLIYRGAPVCQDFGNTHFFYTSCVMNCLFDCQYCYLKGMYPSGNMVIFVNLEDVFAEVERKLQQLTSLYLCVSYDTDLLALEKVTGFVEEWIRFTEVHPGLTIEVRTKSASKDLIREMPVCDRVIFAYTLSPEEIIRKYEPGTGSLGGRLSAAALCLERGVPTRLCFDPMLFVPEWRALYSRLFEQASEALPFDKVKDFSVGTFRISTDYMKQMRNNYPDTSVIWYPFSREKGYCQYPDRLASELENFAVGQIRSRYEGVEIFRIC